MQMRIMDGMWAIPHAGSLHIGVLDGDIESGWHATYCAIAEEHLADVIHRLNDGGLWSNGSCQITAADSSSMLLGTAGLSRTLDIEATARLQIACSYARAGVQTAGSDYLPMVSVASRRGGLAIQGVAATGAPHGRAQVLASIDGGVVLALPTTAGPFTVGLPALPVLVAAAEAARDRVPVAIDLTVLGRGVQTVKVSAIAAGHAAAEAQWLLPAFDRRLRRDPV